MQRLLLAVAGLVLAGFLAATVSAGTTAIINGTKGNDVLKGTKGSDVLNGKAGNDKLYGYAGNDRLNGGPGKDTMSGGAGNDSLNGGPGKDVMTGGQGADGFVCTPGDTVYADIADSVPATCTNVRGLPPPAQASVADAAMPEGDTGTKVLSFPVTLAAASPYIVTVSYVTADGTATAGSDYVAASGTLTFNPGETSKAIDVTVNGDTVVEPDETFTITLSNPQHAALVKASATGSIQNEDKRKPITGHYSGATAQGYDISFDVADDAKSLSNANMTIDADCGAIGTVQFTGNWGQAIKLNQDDWSWSDALGADAPDGSAIRVYFRGSLTLDGKANGSVQGELVLQSIGITCQSGFVSFAASHQ